MKKYSLLLFAVVLFCGCGSGSEKKNAVKAKSYSSERAVWICNSPKAKVYHLEEDCKGLDRCSHEIIKVSEDEAREYYGRRACKICTQ